MVAISECSFCLVPCKSVTRGYCVDEATRLHDSLSHCTSLRFCSSFLAQSGLGETMVLALNKSRLDNLASDIWKSAERLRGKFKAYEYQNVILPIIVIRRLECVLIEWRAAKADPGHCPFSNKTAWTLGKVHAQDHALLEESFRDYIDGFSANVNDIIEHFNYRATIGLMVKHNRLAPILGQYKDLALGPGQLSGLEMGYVYEE